MNNIQDHEILPMSKKDHRCRTLSYLHLEGVQKYVEACEIQEIPYAMLKGDVNNLPKLIKRAGKLYWNIVHIVAYQASYKEAI